ncbi:MAG: hypothetical protein H0W61_02715 [Bacteroidetes bacterium]|nr:hypothetical protein [Bacteroidota bacterium]
MRTLKIIFALSFLLSLTGFAQKGRGHGHGGGRGYHHNKVVLVKRSMYRPKKVIVFHPVWRPTFGYNRRWVFFPKHNLYWDNWRNHYVYWNGVVWVSQPSAPPVVINVNLEKEKHYELNEKEDDDDDVYKGNDTHKTEYKPE